MAFFRPSALYRTTPFIVFMAFVAIEEVLVFFTNSQAIHVPATLTCYLYPVKAGAACALLVLFLPHYKEVRISDLKSYRTLISVLTGSLIFILWINMDHPALRFGSQRIYDPEFYLKNPVLAAVRLCGAGIIVPVMEELFWRSFLLRYLVDDDFERVPIGRFTWASFIISTILFGLEHNLIVAGMLAGALYNLLLYYTKSLSQCILAHAVTNLALGVYVLQTGNWHFW